MASEYDELVRICTLPIQQIPETVFYSTANYEPIAINSHAIGQSIARGLCQQLDFPRLINRVHADGARIFVEAGAGSTCSRWIKETLKEQEHITIPLNQRGVTDHKSIVKALAKLVSHRVAVDLSPLYNSEKIAIHKNPSLSKIIKLGGTPISCVLLSVETQNIVKAGFSNDLLPLAVKEPPIPQNLLPLAVKEPPIPQNLLPIDVKEPPIPQNVEESPMPQNLSPIDVKEPPISQNLSPIDVEEPPMPQNLSPLAVKEPPIPQNLSPIGVKESPIPQNLSHSNPPQISQTYEQKEEVLLSVLQEPQYQHNSEYNANLTKVHTAFLQGRQEGLKQLGEIIQLQIAIAQNLWEAHEKHD